MTFRFPNESDSYRDARNDLLEAEVELRAHIEAVAAQRRQLPDGGPVSDSYSFEQMNAAGEVHPVRMSDLFGDHDSLLIYSMMFGADWDAPCPSCTNIVDSINANRLGVEANAALAVVAGASPGQLRDWADRRNWTVNLLSSANSSYILDYAGFETDDPGAVSCMNVFRKTSEGVVHFWASELLSRPMENGHPRHVDIIWPMWNLLDMTPTGRGDAVIPPADFEHKVFSERFL